MTLRILEPPAGSAMAKAFLRIRLECSEAVLLKQRLRRMMALGTGHRAVQARYGARAKQLIGVRANNAARFLDREYRDQRQAFRIASALGHGSRLSLDVLYECRIVARLMRRDPVLAKHFIGVVRFVAAGVDDR